MPKLELLIGAAGALGLVSFGTLVMNVYKTRNTTSFPWSWLLLNFLGQAMSFVYGIVNEAYGIYSINAILMAGLIYVMYAKFQYSKEDIEKKEESTGSSASAGGSPGGSASAGGSASVGGSASAGSSASVGGSVPGIDYAKVHPAATASGSFGSFGSFGSSGSTTAFGSGSFGSAFGSAFDSASSSGAAFDYSAMENSM